MGDDRIEIVLGTRNAGKCEEMMRLLAPYGVTVTSLADFPDVPDVVEDGHTFAENAEKKATQTARSLGRWVVAEDSGLMVDALGGRPGVYSKRYSGPGATDQSNNEKLLGELRGVAEADRVAGYVCHVVVAAPNGAVRWRVEARCRGRIATSPRGTAGFGYDPVFLIPEYHRTFAELGARVKNLLSHRGRAFQMLIPQLVRLLRTSES